MGGEKERWFHHSSKPELAAGETVLFCECMLKKFECMLKKFDCCHKAAKAFVS